MSNEQLLHMAERNLKKAEKAYRHNYNRPGATETERQNLIDNIEFAKIVMEKLSE